MQPRTSLLALCALLAAPVADGAAFDRATITELVREVSVLTPASRNQRSARLRDVFATPEVLRTGPEARAEMIAEDQTVTRVGANSLFSFEPKKREINLERGSVLFNSPSGKGGGTIRTAAATAAVLGTTLIVITTKNGGFKVLLIEGRGKVTSAKGEARILNAGQMVFVLPGQKMGPVFNFQLKEQVAASRLIGGFKSALPSQPKIAAAIARQNAEIARGTLVRTGLLAGENPNEAYQVDPGAREAMLDDKPTAAEIFGLGSAVIAAPKLDPARIFQGGTGAARGGTLFLAENITFQTPSIDLGPYPGESFEFVSLDSLHFARSLVVNGPAGMPVSFVAGGTITNAPGTVVQLDNPLTGIYALGSLLPRELTRDPGLLAFSDQKPLRLVDFALFNRGGQVNLFSPSLSLTNAGLMAAGDLQIHARGSISISDNITARPSWAMGPAGVVGPGPFPTAAPIPKADTSFSLFGTALEAGQLLSISAEKDFSADNTDFVAERTEIRAGGALRAKSVRFSNRDFAQNRGSVFLQAGGLLEVAGARFQASHVAMQAHTIVLRNLSFADGSTVLLRSALGQLAGGANTGAPPVPGMVNFVRDVNYGASPAQLNLRTTPGPGIQISR